MAHYGKKAEEIQAVLSQPEVDLWKLRELALSEGGLVNDSLRQQAWPKLVGIHGLDENRQHLSSILSEEPSTSNAGLSPLRKGSTSRSHRHALLQAVATRSLDAGQVELDVTRCTWHLLTGNQRVQRLQMEYKRNRKVARVIQRKQRRLANLINLALVKSYKQQTLRYYQGYHDVACIFLSALGGATNNIGDPHGVVEAAAASLGLDLPLQVLYQISQSHLFYFMQSNFSSLQSMLHLTLFPMLAFVDLPVHDHLHACGMEPIFCLSWIITWFAHEIRDTQLVKRLFDAFLVSHPLFPLYISIVMITHPLNRTEILETDCDFASLHVALSNLPRNSSAIGWKYRPDQGYVSDDNVEDDVTTTRTDDDTSYLSHVDWSNELMVEIGDEERDAEGTSVTSSWANCSSTLEPPSQVSFENLIEAALKLMARIPPHKLGDLASRYYRSNVGRHESFLRSIPGWATASKAKPDWLLKQEQRGRHGQSASRQAIKRSKFTLDEQWRKFGERTAVIALGGSVGAVELRRRRKRIRLAMAGAMLGTILIIVYRIWGFRAAKRQNFIMAGEL